MAHRVQRDAGQRGLAAVAVDELGELPLDRRLHVRVERVVDGVAAMPRAVEEPVVEAHVEHRLLAGPHAVVVGDRIGLQAGRSDAGAATR